LLPIYRNIPPLLPYTPHLRSETSEASQRRLHTFVTQAIAQGEAFVPIAWKLADNRIAVLDAQAIVAAHLAAAGHVAACHARAQEIGRAHVCTPVTCGNCYQVL